MNRIEIFTDGACRGNPGKGGWGVMIRSNGLEESLYGGSISTTNNIMELTAAIKALEHIPKNSNVVLTTDSKYVMQGITEWINNWKKRNWKKASSKPVLNKELWIKLDNLTNQHSIKWKWVKGHSGHRENEIADQLANKGIDEI